MPADEFVAQDIPPRTWLVEGVIPHPSAGMLYAYRGIGKTLVTMDLALALTQGREWLGYKVPQKRTGLYIDGEMPRADMIQRLRAQCAGVPVPTRLNILSAEAIALKHWNLNLAREQDRETLGHAIASWEALNHTGLDFIVIDNWTSLIRGIDENDNSEMDAIKAWLILLRHAGISVILVHHAGKDGRTQRGGSAREDVLDYSIRLRRQDNQSDQSMFLEWDKARSGLPDPSSFPVDIVKEGDAIRLQRAEKAVRKNNVDEAILTLIRTTGPKSMPELVDILKLSQSTLYRKISKFLNEKKLVRTKSGSYDVDA